jgi:hypothetical protein
VQGVYGRLTVLLVKVRSFVPVRRARFSRLEVLKSLVED